VTHRHLQPPHRRPPRPTKPPAAPPRPDAGPRPLSPRQEAARAGRLTGSDIVERSVPRRAAGTPARPSVRRHIRDAETSVVRVHRARPRGNRRRVDRLAVAVQLAAIFLGLEAAAVLLFSPRLAVQSVQVEGNTSLPSGDLVRRLGIAPGANIVRLPTWKLRKAVLTEPAVESAEIHRAFPGTVRLVIAERKPWATVCLPTGKSYIIDDKLIPFREVSSASPELPKVTLAMPAAGNVAAPVTLGKALTAPGLDVVSRCLNWATAHQFPVSAIALSPDGKLDLNRTGGLEVQLGTGTDLDKKLKALSELLVRKPDLRTGNDVAYVNLFAYEAPALLPRSAVAPATALGLPPAGAVTEPGGSVIIERPLVKTPRVRAVFRSTPPLAQADSLPPARGSDTLQ
jgi:cell division septal protein FtsQ